MSDLPEIIKFRLPAKTITPRNPRPRDLAPPVDTVESEPPARTEDPPSATAGTPGSFSPEDFQPRTVTEMKDERVVPIPVSPWAEGESVRLANNNYCHWNGETWRSGKAPAAE